MYQPHLYFNQGWLGGYFLFLPINHRYPFFPKYFRIREPPYNGPWFGAISSTHPTLVFFQPSTLQVPFESNLPTYIIPACIPYQLTLVLNPHIYM
jgi:hypothetical protein